MKPTRLHALAALLTPTPALQAADGSLSFKGASRIHDAPNSQNAVASDEVTVELWAKTNAPPVLSVFP